MSSKNLKAPTELSNRASFTQKKYFRVLCALLCALFVGTAWSAPSAQDGIATWDPNMAAENAAMDEARVKWIDGKSLPIEGRAFDDVEHWYDRLPADVSTSVNAGVRGMKHHTAGMQFRFKTDSKTLRFKWTPWNAERLAMGHMASTGVSGLDIYRQRSDGRWLHVRSFKLPDIVPEDGFAFDIDWKYGGPCLVYLPLYNGIRSFSLGIDPEAAVEPLPPRASGVEKPVVFYGTSITQGACASRPGMAFVNIVGRDLDVPVVNLGFAGCGRMEREMSEHLARIDASCYVLDCLWNMGSADADNRPGRNVEENYEPFIRALRARRPGVPIVMAGQCNVRGGAPNAKERFVKALHDRLVAEGWRGLVFLPGSGMFADDSEGTVDGVHPNDHGMMSLAKAYGAAVAEALAIHRDE